jgi:hypothetical protein
MSDMNIRRHISIRLSPPPDCDHDASASGGLVIDGDTVRAEVTCERCGRTIEVLGSEPYTPEALIPVAV